MKRRNKYEANKSVPTCDIPLHPSVTNRNMISAGYAAAFFRSSLFSRKDNNYNKGKKRSQKEWQLGPDSIRFQRKTDSSTNRRMSPPRTSGQLGILPTRHTSDYSSSPRAAMFRFHWCDSLQTYARPSQVRLLSGSITSDASLHLNVDEDLLQRPR